MVGLQLRAPLAPERRCTAGRLPLVEVIYDGVAAEFAGHQPPPHPSLPVSPPYLLSRLARDGGTETWKGGGD